MKEKSEWETLFIITRDLQSTAANAPLNFKITMAQERILAYIFQEDGVMQSQLVQFLHNTPATVSVAVESLVKKGLLERVSKEGDRRAIFLKLTGKGEMIREAFRTYFNEKMEELFRNISEEERKIFSSVLTKLLMESEKIYSVKERKIK